MSSPAPAGPDPAELAAALVESLVLVRRLVGSGDGRPTLTALTTLAALQRLGPSRVGVLAEAAEVSQPAMTQLLTRLGGQGLVVRSAQSGDGRVVLVTLTELGARVLAARRADLEAELAQRAQALDGADRAALAAALPALRRLAQG